MCALPRELQGLAEKECYSRRVDKTVLPGLVKLFCRPVQCMESGVQAAAGLCGIACCAPMLTAAHCCCPAATWLRRPPRLRARRPRS